jgi:hypothetical protein
MGGFLFLAHTSQIHRLIMLNGGCPGLRFLLPGSWGPPFSYRTKAQPFEPSRGYVERRVPRVAVSATRVLGSAFGNSSPFQPNLLAWQSVVVASWHRSE